MNFYGQMLEPGPVGIAAMELMEEGDTPSAQLRSREGLKARFGESLT